MTTVATMDSQLTLDNKSFITSIGQASGQLLKFGAIAGGAAAAGLVIFTKREFEALDATTKLSRELQITSSSLQGFELGAELAGASAKNIDDALRRLPKTLGEARRGLKTAQDGFKELNLDFNDLIKLKPDEAMLRIADATKSIQDPTKKAAALTAIFGRNGQKLTNFLNQGSEAIRGILKESDRLSGVFTDLELGGVEQANDELVKLQLSFRSIFKKIAVEAAPLVSAIFKKLTDAIVSFRDNTLPIIINWANDVLTTVRSTFVSIGPAILQFGRTIFSGFQTIFGGIVGLVNLIGSGLSKMSGAFNKNRKDSITWAEGLTEAMIIVKFAFQSLEPIAENAALRITGFFEKTGQAVRGLVAFIGSSVDLVTDKVDIADVLGSVVESDEFKKSKARQKQLAKELEKSNKDIFDRFAKFRQKEIDRIKKDKEDIEDALTFKFEIPELDLSGGDGDLGALGGGQRDFTLRGIERGSQEAQKSIFALETAGQTVEKENLNVNKEQLKVQQENLKEQKKQTKELKNADNDNGANVVILGFS